MKMKRKISFILWILASVMLSFYTCAALTSYEAALTLEYSDESVHTSVYF